ncbi:L-ascorbate metabolism protein UlaG, beta-lactamase superfamily [Streptacidiphilus jiangxiensis]|uniref:L-ascorbate metabolism protein UlaG, beta-lactamase superfamily n=2 Tax=Streptacidiphilus jiangxiensis TaxID=235985 RepID=A0A1H7ZWT1_STRJI|nr:L-ascorbate metabolism protein UlaG, beta-lactamase superfamily [Streptacidiphilus jiangxiensis]
MRHGQTTVVDDPAADGPPATERLILRWLGVSGWELRFGRSGILFDPYLSRMPFQSPDGAIDPSLPLRLDRAAVAGIAGHRLAGPPDLVLVSHGHFDHLADVPQLLAHPGWAGHRIRTLCDETVDHLLAALGTPARRLADVIRVRGGEHLRFPGFSVAVLPSLHSQHSDHGYFAPGTRVLPPSAPRSIGDLVEGRTLAYLISFDEGPSVYLAGTSNLVERELVGLRPDVAVVGMTSYSAVERYLDRLLDALGDPRLLIPTHHDDMISPLPGANEGTARESATTRSSAALLLEESVAARGAAGTLVVDPVPLRPFSV